MSQNVSEQFNQSLRSSPSGQRKSGTMFDEIYGALETSQNPIDRAIQMISEFHGVWTGGSRELFQFSSFLASATGSNALRNIALQVGEATCRAETLNNQLPPSKVGRQNNEFAAIMPAPLLREFVTFAHNIHPALNMYFQLHAGNFPYFQQISEEVGRFAHITSRSSEIDPMKWPKMNGVDCLDTNSRMDANTLGKMFPSTFFQMDNASNLLNSLFLRSMRPENNMSFLKTEYSQEQPIAHGHNFCMDVFGNKRRVDAVPGCAAVVMQSSGDSLRLIDKFFPVRQVGKYETETFNITLNHGPNGEPMTFITDSRGRLFNNSEESTAIDNTTNDRMITAKDEYKEEKR
jgi:hypothetical protein